MGTIKKIIIICLLAFAGGFLDAALIYRNVNITCTIFTVIGYIDCLIANEEKIFGKGEKICER